MIGSNLKPSRRNPKTQMGPVIWSHCCMLPNNFLGRRKACPEALAPIHSHSHSHILEFPVINDNDPFMPVFKSHRPRSTSASPSCKAGTVLGPVPLKRPSLPPNLMIRTGCYQSHRIWFWSTVGPPPVNPPVGRLTGVWWVENLEVLWGRVLGLQ